MQQQSPLCGGFVSVGHSVFLFRLGRRFFRLRAVASPTGQLKVQLGHRVLGVTERYAEFDPQYLKEASQAIQDFWELRAPIWRQQKTDDYEKSLQHWCRLRGLNSRPSVYKTAALPLS
jgi:hypothetical protein